MGFLTEAMSELRCQVEALRRDRQALRTGLQQQDRERQKAVAEMCTQFSAVRVGMARRSARERKAFLDDLRGMVRRQRDQVRADVAGARRVWGGA